MDKKTSGVDKDTREAQPTGSEPKKVQGGKEKTVISGAPNLIGQLSGSGPPKVPESHDVEYLTMLEAGIGDEINTLKEYLEPHPDAPANWPGPWIERCIGRNPDTNRLQVVRIPAVSKPVEPFEVMQYLGPVTQDHLSVHTGNFMFKKKRIGYCFDRFFIYNGSKEGRCCRVPNKVHQAALMYEKQVDRKTRKAFSRIRQIKGHMGQYTGEPTYRVMVGNNEGYYRELKRIFERYFMKRGDEALADDIGLKSLMGRK